MFIIFKLPIIYNMRNRNLVLGLALTFFCMSVYHLYFTYLNIKIQNEANVNATVDGIIDFKKRQEYLDSIWDKPVKKILFKEYTYEQIKSKSLNLGLDLQGGASIVIDIDVDALLKQVVNKKYKNNLLTIIEKISPDYKINTKEYINQLKLRIKELNEKDIFVKFFENTRNGINEKSTDSDVEEFLINKIDASEKKTYDIIRSRLDKYGIVQPNIQRLKGNRKIQIEISGAYNQKSINNLLQGVGELKFYEVYDYNNLSETFDSINKLLEKESIKDSSGNLIKFNSSMTFKSDVIDSVLKVFELDYIKELLPDDLLVCKMSEEKAKKKDSNEEQIFLLKTDSNGNEFLNGDVISDARQSIDEKGRPCVVIKMNAVGKKVWADLTSKNIGKMIAMTFDNKVIMAANVMYKITDGVTQISGNYTNEEASNLAMTLKTGSLPVPIHIVDETIVGPNLSVETQKQGLKAILYGLLLVLFFMILFYSTSGLISNFALIINLLFIFGVLTQIGAVLTLPGIAGVILILGMAVDANIIINERVKEEIKLGKGVREAVKLGYKMSNSSILDANITTLLTGIVLYIFGSGPIKGFAITMIIGICCSLFTSVLLTRYIFYIKEQNRSIKNVRFSWFNIKNKNNSFVFNFVKTRVISYIFSVLVIAVGCFFLHKNKGLNKGIEFTGGNSFIIKMSENVDLSEISEKLGKYLNENVIAKSYSGNNIIKLTTKFTKGTTEELNSFIKDAIINSTGFSYIDDSSDKKGIKFEIIGNESVEPTMASDIKNNSVKAIIYVLLIIFLYIFMRFGKWQFGFAALLSLLHDIIFVFAVCGIARKFGYNIEINQIFIASMLTLIGYSVNNTVIIFDRIRESLKNNNLLDFTSNINSSITNTLTRTILTSLSTILMVLILFIFGGSSLSEFTFILLVGFIIGTYSSIFISATLLKDLVKKI